MSDTPETDAMEYCDAMCDPDRVVEADFARKLERERDDILAQLREEQQLHVQTLNERDEAQETIATMEIRHAAVMLHTQSIVDDANQCREQRDRLAAAVNAATVLIAAKGRHNTLLAYEGLRSALSPENVKVHTPLPANASDETEVKP